MIAGVQVIPLQRIPDERGTVYHMLKRTDKHFIEFGEIYFSTVYPGVVKGWHLHKAMTLNYACIQGRIKLVIYDERPDSATRGDVTEIFLGPDSYSLVVIPPNLWNGFKGMGEDLAIVADCITKPWDEAQAVRLDPLDGRIPYDWRVQPR